MKKFITTLNPIHRFLCKAISQKHKRKLADIYSEIEDATLWEEAKSNRVESTVAHALFDILGKDNARSHWRDIHDESLIRISSFLAELDRISFLLDKEGVGVLILENAAVARGVYSCPGCFSFGDLDIIVCKEDLPIIHKILTQQGNYSAITPFDGLIHDISDLSEGRLVLATTLKSHQELRINFQWSMVARQWFTSEQEPDFNTLFDRAKTISNSAVRMLNPEDNLFQLAVHNAAHGYVRKPGISLHMDVDRFVHGVRINWETFVLLVKQFKVKTKAYFSLKIPKELFSTPIPDEVLSALKPPAWKENIIAHWLNRVGFFNPHARKFGRVEYIIFASLLYDDAGGLLKSIFPAKKWMREKYNSKNDIHLLFLYFKRLIDLAFRRVKT